MSEEKSTSKVGRPARTLDEEIAAAEERLRQLRERKKDDERRERERNQKAILGLIRSEALDLVPVDAWKQALPKLRAALKLGAQPSQRTTPTGAEAPESSETSTPH